MRKFAVYIALFLAAVALFGRKPDAPSTVAPSPPAPPAISSPAPAQAPVETPGMALAPTPVETVPVPTPEKLPAVRMYVTGNGVGFRSGPSTAAAIIDRFDKGREVNVLGSAEEWSQVRDQLSHEMGGWLHACFHNEGQRRRATRASPSQRGYATPLLWFRCRNRSGISPSIAAIRVLPRVLQSERGPKRRKRAPNEPATRLSAFCGGRDAA